jgi:hypothetical protein
MRIFFDVDLTILGQDGTLRPGTRELFVRLVDEGHEVYVWSGFGDRRDDLARHDLDGMVHGYYRKPLTRMYASHEEWGLPFRPDFVVDDHPGPPLYMGGINVEPYVDRTSASTDTEMARVYDAIVRALEPEGPVTPSRSDSRPRAR